jgi:hypothetical protein
MEANPNLFTNAFNAKVFVMFEDGQMRMSSQVCHPSPAPPQTQRLTAASSSTAAGYTAGSGRYCQRLQG